MYVFIFNLIKFIFIYFRPLNVNSLWGGITKNVAYMSNSEWQHTSGVLIFISGTMETWYIILDNECKTVELIVEKLISFKKRVKLRKYSIGFMFTTKSRKYLLPKKKNVESTLFKKIFPKVPLVGCYGLGVFEKNTADDRGDFLIFSSVKSSSFELFIEFLSLVFLFISGILEEQTNKQTKKIWNDPYIYYCKEYRFCFNNNNNSTNFMILTYD